MNRIQTIKNAAKAVNPIAAARRYRMRKQLKNRDVSFLTPNCLGGILFHDLGLQFRSPTVNLSFTQKDFLNFVLHLDAYLDGSFVFFRHEELTCPCARLKAPPLPDLTVHFTHYGSCEEAQQKWESRKTRINRENLFVFMEERDGITGDDLLALSALRVRGLVVFTCREYPDLPYTVCLPEYRKDGEVGNILKRNYINDSRKYETYFDFVRWFNEADGAEYDVRRFIRK